MINADPLTAVVQLAMILTIVGILGASLWSRRRRGRHHRPAPGPVRIGVALWRDRGDR